MNQAYEQGREARRAGWSAIACPYGSAAGAFGSGTFNRQQSALAQRHWWLAGWHDADIEFGHTVLEEIA